MSDIQWQNFIKKSTIPLRWKIFVGGGYGQFDFVGTEEEAEKMRSHKANWERAVARKKIDAEYYSGLEADNARLREELAAAYEKVKELETPNLFWDEANPEIPIDDIANYCDYCVYGSEAEPLVSIEVQCARSFENKFAHYRWNAEEEQMDFLGLFDAAIEAAKEVKK